LGGFGGGRGGLSLVNCWNKNKKWKIESEEWGLFTSDDFVNERYFFVNWFVGDKEFLVLRSLVWITSSFASSFKLSDDNKVWLAEAEESKGGFIC